MLAKSFLTAVVASVVVTFVLVIGGGILAGGVGAADFVWMFCVSVVPIAISCMVLGTMSPRLRKSERSRWIAAIITGFFTVTVAGSVTAPIVQSLQFGFQHVNVHGYVTWGPIYGLYLLPLSVPLAYLVIRVLLTGTANNSLQRTPPGGRRWSSVTSTPSLTRIAVPPSRGGWQRAQFGSPRPRVRYSDLRCSNTTCSAMASSRFSACVRPRAVMALRLRSLRTPSRGAARQSCSLPPTYQTKPHKPSSCEPASSRVSNRQPRFGRSRACVLQGAERA